MRHFVPRMGTKSREKNIAVTFPIGLPHSERIRTGILDYAKSRADWRLVFSLDGGANSLRGLDRSDADGVIAMIESSEDLSIARSLSIQVINVGSAIEAGNFPTVTVDNFFAGAEAARHLIERGFRRFGFHGVRDLHYSNQRQKGFASVVKEGGFELSEFVEESDAESEHRWRSNHEEMDRWLSSLRTPVGILGTHDYRAALIRGRCSHLGMDIPRDVGLVGMDNDRIVCEGRSPTMTSIRHHGERVGSVAAELLDELMEDRDGRHGSSPILIPPLRLVVRDSTARFVADDPRLAKAVMVMTDGFGGAMGMDEVADACGVSRRWLERNFSKHFGKSPHAFLTNLRIERAKELLTSDDAPSVRGIAEACGFSSTRRLRAMFLKVTGSSIDEFVSKPKSSR